MGAPGEDITERLLVDAGISEGMRVLDVGCGAGAVTALIARLVGPTGQVVGVDRDPDAIEAARERMRALGLHHVSFEVGDLRPQLEAHAPFDAAVWRRVLMYQPDAVVALRRVAEALRPEGLMVLQEHDATTVATDGAALPLQQRAHAWTWETVAREGANVHMGLELASALTRAGLHLVHIRAEAIVQTPTQHSPIAPLLQVMLPRMARHGVVTAQELDLDTIDARIVEERRQADATFIGGLIFCAWAHTAP